MVKPKELTEENEIRDLNIFKDDISNYNNILNHSGIIESKLQMIETIRNMVWACITPILRESYSYDLLEVVINNSVPDVKDKYEIEITFVGLANAFGIVKSNILINKFKGKIEIHYAGALVNKLWVVIHDENSIRLIEEECSIDQSFRYFSKRLCAHKNLMTECDKCFSLNSDLHAPVHKPVISNHQRELVSMLSDSFPDDVAALRSDLRGLLDQGHKSLFRNFAEYQKAINELNNTFDFYYDPQALKKLINLRKEPLSHNRYESALIKYFISYWVKHIDKK